MRMPCNSTNRFDQLYSPTGISISVSIPAMNIPPPSILSVLETAVPTSVLGQLGDPSARASLISEIQAGSTPGWIQSLPPDVKSYISTAYAASATPTGSSGAQATASTTGSQGATSTGGAAAPTGAIAASLAGAAGILGLAIAL